MNGCTINIADFRCRALHARAARPIVRNAHPSTGLALVEREETADRAEDAQCAVYDIGEAHAARMRQRMVSRPMAAGRRANVLRFRASEPVRMPQVVRMNEPLRMPMRMSVRIAEQRERFRGAAEAPYDLPPAA